MKIVEPWLQMRGITKQYAVTGQYANTDVDIEVRRGEIHAIAGENGAGKTTLMKILYGLEHPDSGKIILDGREVKMTSPMTASKLGIGMVQQHFRLVQEFTVAQNVVLGAEPVKAGIFFSQSSAVKSVERLIKENDFHIKPDAKIRNLSVGQMQQVEILKMLYRKADLLILDEPTSVLTDIEIERLFKTLKKLVAQGKTVILITHKLSEIKDISDRITVMRKGCVVGVADTVSVDSKELSRLMVGRSIELTEVERLEGCREPVLVMEGVNLLNKNQDRPVLEDISFSASGCEVVGITAVAGNGLAELEDVIAGLRRVSSGKIYHNDEDITFDNTALRREGGLSYVPTDRLWRGASLSSAVSENVMITGRRSFTRRAGIIDRQAVDDYTDKLIKTYQIDGFRDAPIGTLSGGNIQKVILARELDSAGDVVLFAEPTWGLDIASSEYIYKRIIEMRERGVAVILISSNIDEILTLSDTVMVLYRGRFVFKQPNSENLNRELIGEYMMGLKEAEL